MRPSSARPLQRESTACIEAGESVESTLGAEAFAGFWMGGYEGADHVNGAGLALDMLCASGHLSRLDEDYRRAAQAGIRCVRESIGWRLAESADGHIDLTRALYIQSTAQRHGLQVLWTLMHYGVPADLSLHDDRLVRRLARFAAEVARVLGPGEERPPVYTPVNEIGFLAWAASQPGLLCAPNNTVLDGSDAALERSRINGYVVKCRLVRAALAAQAAMRAADPRARFLHVEPVVHVVAPLSQPDLAALAVTVAGWQWQACDMLTGQLEPQLGGHPDALDLLGLNHYHTSQWEVGTGARVDWFSRDPRWRPLGELLTAAWQRYGRPLIVAETSHVGDGRAAWLHEVAGEVRRARQAGVPVQGLCLYPMVDRPDWAEPTQWHRSGVWHVDTARAAGAPPALQRSAEAPVLDALRQWQRVLPATGSAANASAHERSGGADRTRPVLLAFSHRRWDSLQHRSRHLLQRLAVAEEGWRVVFVEEPLRGETARLDVITLGPHLDVVVPHTAAASVGHRALLQEGLQDLLRPWLQQQGISRPTAWLNTPMAWPLARSLDPARVVLDCADDTLAAAGMPPEWEALECELLATADLVLACRTERPPKRALLPCGRSLLLPNGVDMPLFGVRNAPPGWATEEAALILVSCAAAATLAAPLPAPSGAMPQLGYAGAVDERMDLELLAALADARAHWQFVMIGPVVNIDAAQLPQRPNIHWLGQQPYRVLPALMMRWQVALLPWHLNALTEHSQPLQVPEALAAGLPVVAPPLADLQCMRPHGVHTALGLHDFLRACSACMAEGPAQRRLRRRAGLRYARSVNWADITQSCARALSDLTLA